MNEREVQKILTEILYATLNEIENSPAVAKKITSDILMPLCSLAKKHDVAHLVSSFVRNNKIEIDAEIKKKLQTEEFASIFRNEQMKYVFEQICDAFDEKQISYVPLKGSVIRPYYPYESMRTSCDIDILIHEEDIESAVKCLENKGYRSEKKKYHEVSLYSPKGVHLELHFNIKENMDNLDAVLDNAWEYTQPNKESQYEFKKEFFVFYMYAHMAYHFLGGGCGIRSLMDIWIMEHKMDATYQIAEDLLKKAGIYKFATRMSDISNKCFAENTLDDSSQLILKYIYDGGVYGKVENNLAVKKSKNISPWLYALKRLFLPYKFMTILYPVLKKAPYLLPFCWILRWGSVIFGGKMKRISSEISCVNNMPDEKVAEIKEIRSQVGL